MSEAFNATQHALDLARDENIELSTLEGTGANGQVTKNDVRDAIEARDQAESEAHVGEVPAIVISTPHPETNIMDALKAQREAVEPSNELPVDPQAYTQADLVSIIRELQGEVKELTLANQARVQRDSYERDLTDELLFIAKPNGEHWTESRVVDNQTIGVEFTATAFFGPFNAETEIEAYLAEKASKRLDSAIDWQGVYTIRGHEARSLQAQEKQERESQFQGSTPTNVLDRRIFAENHTGHTPGNGTLLGQQQG